MKNIFFFNVIINCNENKSLKSNLLFSEYCNQCLTDEFKNIIKFISPIYILFQTQNY